MTFSLIFWGLGEGVKEGRKDRRGKEEREKKKKERKREKREILLLSAIHS